MLYSSLGCRELLFCKCTYARYPAAECKQIHLEPLVWQAGLRLIDHTNHFACIFSPLHIFNSVSGWIPQCHFLGPPLSVKPSSRMSPSRQHSVKATRCLSRPLN